MSLIHELTDLEINEYTVRGCIWLHGAPGVRKMSMGIKVKSSPYVAHTAEVTGRGLYGGLDGHQGQL